MTRRRPIRDLDGHDPYDLLGVEPTASRDEILDAYRHRIRVVHSDLPGGSHVETALLNVAKDVLLDQQTREQYDSYKRGDPTKDNSERPDEPWPSEWDSTDVTSGDTEQPKSLWDEETVTEPEPPPTFGYEYPTHDTYSDPYQPYHSHQPYTYPTYQAPTYPAYSWYDHQAVPPKPDSYLAWAVVTLVCCCWPVSIAAVVYAAKVDSLWRSGRYAEAKHASSRARTFTVLSVLIGLVGLGVYLILLVAGVAA